MSVLDVVKQDNRARLEIAREEYRQAQEACKDTHSTNWFKVMESFSTAHEKVNRLYKEQIFLIRLSLGEIPLN
jgi:hypothetical protein